MVVFTIMYVISSMQIVCGRVGGRANLIRDKKTLSVKGGILKREEVCNGSSMAGGVTIV